jgi:3-hydroxyisobutyrate dehydrogenase
LSASNNNSAVGARVLRRACISVCSFLDYPSRGVGLLGVELIGSAMAHRLMDQGIPVIAWDRNSEQVRALGDLGAAQASGPGEVVSVAGVVITMLPTAEIVFEVIQPLLDEWPKDTIWLQMSSVGAGEADRLTHAAELHAVRIVDAPVSASTLPAEKGQLTILASLDPSPRGRRSSRYLMRSHRG